jgi:DNA invertase Pin-like site-specific DNA recombinase
MRKIKEVLRLRFELRLGQRAIARACSISQSTVHEYLNRAPQPVWCGRWERSGTSSVSSRHCSESGRW